MELLFMRGLTIVYLHVLIVALSHYSQVLSRIGHGVGVNAYLGYIQCRRSVNELEPSYQGRRARP